MNNKCRYCVEGYCSKKSERVNNKMLPCAWVRLYCKKRIPRKLKKGVKWGFKEQEEVNKLFLRFAPDFDKQLAEHGLTEELEHKLDVISKHCPRHRGSKWEWKANFIMSHWHDEEYGDLLVEKNDNKYTDVLNDYWNFLTDKWNLHIL